MHRHALLTCSMCDASSSVRWNWCVEQRCGATNTSPVQRALLCTVLLLQSRVKPTATAIDAAASRLVDALSVPGAVSVVFPEGSFVRCLAPDAVTATPAQRGGAGGHAGAGASVGAHAATAMSGCRTLGDVVAASAAFAGDEDSWRGQAVVTTSANASGRGGKNRKGKGGGKKGKGGGKKGRGGGGGGASARKRRFGPDECGAFSGAGTSLDEKTRAVLGNVVEVSAAVSMAPPSDGGAVLTSTPAMPAPRTLLAACCSVNAGPRH